MIFSELMRITYARHVIVSARLMNGKWMNSFWAIFSLWNWKEFCLHAQKITNSPNEWTHQLCNADCSHAQTLMGANGTLVRLRVHDYEWNVSVSISLERAFNVLQIEVHTHTFSHGFFIFWLYDSRLYLSLVFFVSFICQILLNISVFEPHFIMFVSIFIAFSKTHNGSL